MELKDYIVCDESINGKYGFYSIRYKDDCNPLRFKVLADFDTYEEADDYVDFLKHPQDYYNIND